MRGLITKFIQGVIISIVTAVIFLIRGTPLNGPVILAFITGIPLGALAFVILRQLKRPIAQRTNSEGMGEFMAWLIAVFSPWCVMFLITASWFGAKLTM
jgi:hypothetical protein